MASPRSPVPIDLDARFRAAVRSYWRTRSKQQKKQRGQDKTIDAGLRAAVTGGAQMSELEELISDILCEAGMLRESIRTKIALELPGYFRPEKKWDLVVVADGQLIAAMELKSQAGPSFGNNFNNRTEEAIGSAADIWTAYREGRMGKREGFRPLLGYFFLLEDCAKVHRPVASKETHFATDPVFSGASYCRRYELLCKRLVQERLYDVACLTLSARAGPAGVNHPAPDLSFELFAAAIKSQVARWLAMTAAEKTSRGAAKPKRAIRADENKPSIE
jgi:hypothetical protein